MILTILYSLLSGIKTLFPWLFRRRRRPRARLAFLLATLLSAQALFAQNINRPNKTGPMGIAVNTNTGNVFLSRTDVYIPARQLDLDVSFSYNSVNYTRNTGYGNGWILSYNMSYRLDTAGHVIIIWDDGREDTYSNNGNGLKAPTGIFDSLSQYQTGKYLLRKNNGLIYYFDNASHKRLTKMTEPNGNYLNFGYTDSLLTSITNAAGQTVSLSYVGGRLTSITDANAAPVQTYSYSYDGYGNLTKVTDPMSGTFKYTYLVNGPLSSVTDKNSNVADVVYYPGYAARELISCNARTGFSYDTTTHTTTVIDFLESGSNQTTAYIYNDKGWLKQFIGACCGNNMTFTYDNAGNLTQRTDANNNVWKFTYDNRGNYLTMTDPLNNVTQLNYTSDFNQIAGIIDPMGNPYVLAYDAAGNPTQITRPDGSKYAATYAANGDMLTMKDANNNVTNYQYDANGYLQKISMPLNEQIQTTFDGRGNMLTGKDPNGNSYSFLYDSLNRLKQITDPISRTLKLSYDKAGNLTTLTDPKGFVQTFTYDASDRTVKFKDAKGNLYSMLYDAMNNLIQYTDPLGKVTSFSYDNQNRLVGITDAVGSGYSLSYDAVGNMTSASMPNGNTVNYTYDVLNRPMSGNDAIGSLGQITYDRNGNVSSYTNANGAALSFAYDNLNRLTRMTDPLGNARVYTYDSNDNLLTDKDRNNHTSSYSYNALNRTISYTDNNNNTTNVQYDSVGNITRAIDQNGNTTFYQYDAANRVYKMVYADGSYTQFTYDNDNNVTAARLADGSTINYTYDSLNRMIAKDYPDGNHFAYTYDAKGQLLSASNTAGTITYTRDALGRITSEGFNNHTTLYSYNIAARVMNTLYPNGTSVIKNFDQRQRLTNIQVNNQQALNNQYDVLGRLTQRSYGNGVTSNYQYNNVNWLTSISSSNASLPSLSFQYDNEGNKTVVMRSNDGFYSETFTYDAAYRLINYKQGVLSGNTISSPLVQNTYTYDAVGNRTSAVLNGVNTTYAVNNLNQYTSANGITFTYDGLGNKTYDGNYYMRYDAQGRKVVDSLAGNIYRYTYDAFGRRITKSVNGVAMNYYYSGLKQIEERDGGDNVVSTQVFERPFMPLMRTTGGQKYFYHSNDLNSTEALTDSTGSLVERYKYEDFGKTSILNAQGNAISSSATNNRFLYTGQEYDGQSKTYQFHFRNYDPGTGTFSQRDPIGYSDQMGLYQYVGNNPGNFTDPWGLAPCPPSVTDVASSYISHTGNLNTILRYLKELRDKYKEVEKPGVKNPFLNKFNIAIQVDNEIASIEQYMEHSNEWDGKEQDIKLAEIEANFAYLGADIAGSKGYENPLIAVTAAVGFLDATTQEVTGAIWGSENSKSLSRIYSELDKGQIEFANKAMERAKQNYDRDLKRIETAEKLFGKDRDKWTDELRETYERVMKSIQLQKEGKISWYKKKVVTPGGNNCPPNDPTPGTQNPPPPPPGQTGKGEVVFEHDPNAIIGPDGAGAAKWVSVNDRLPYTVLFENAKEATAPAKVAKVYYSIDPKQDINTFQLGSFGFNNLTFNVPANTNAYYQRLDARDSLNLYVDVTAGIDAVNRQAFWIFESIDPTTLLPTADPLKGFLLTSDSSSATSGHGFVNFSIKPLVTDVTGDTTSAYANIVFGTNDTIPTNRAKNTIDALPPTTQMGAAQTVSSNVVRLNWSGHDDAGGSGLATYSLYVSTNGRPFSLYRSALASTSLNFNVSYDTTYCFFVTGKDSVNNEEALKNSCDLSVRISGAPLPITWLDFTGVRRGNDGLLAWTTGTELNTKSFVVERSLDGNAFTEIGSVSASGNSNAVHHYTFTDADIIRLGVPVIYYRIKEVDNNARATYSNTIALRVDNGSGQPLVSAFPNPFNQFVTLQVTPTSAQDKTSKVELYSLQGTLLYSREIGKQGTVSIQLNDLPDLAAGLYVLKTTVNGVPYVNKIVKN